MKPSVLLLRGIPGAGKSHLSAQLLKERPGSVVVSADAFFEGDFDGTLLWYAHDLCQRRFVEALQRRVPLIIVDNTNVQAKHIQFYADRAKEYTYDFAILEISCPLEVAVKRNIHGVPQETVEMMAQQMAEPLDPTWVVYQTEFTSGEDAA